MIKLSKVFKVYVGLSFLFLQVTMAFPKSDLRIVGGTSTSIEEAPYLVQIFRDKNFHCGGTIVTDRHIVTAAHCVKGTTPDRFTVVAAASKLTDHGIRSKVSKIIVHANYNKPKYDMDIAVMKLKSPISGPSVQIAPICQQPIYPEDPVQLFGWGRFHEKTDFLALQLQTVNVKIVDHDSCKAMYDPILITENMFCAASTEKDSCTGDSGGPVMVKGKFCGVVSFGIGCARSGYPGVYTKLSNTIPFLQRALEV